MDNLTINNGFFNEKTYRYAFVEEYLMKIIYDSEEEHAIRKGWKSR